MGLARTQQRQKQREDNKKVFLSKKEIDKIKLETYRKAVNIVSDVLDPLLESTLKNSFGWFNGKHSKSRIKRATKVLHEELDKIEMEVSR